MARQAVLRRDDIREFITTLYDGDQHARLVLSLASATLGVLSPPRRSRSMPWPGACPATGRLSEHGVKHVDRLLSNEGLDVDTFFGYWVPCMVGTRTEIVVVVTLDWTSFRE